MNASEAEQMAEDANAQSSRAGASSPLSAAGTPGDTHITIRGLSKTFGDAVIYDNFDLDIPRGRFVSVFGPNGCGKSTLINLISGLIDPDAGTIRFDGKRLRDTNFGYVFQNYREALFPWMRSIDNIRYPLKFRNIPRAEQKERVDRLVERLGVTIDLNKYPYQMSGGQQQLVSIMRSLVIEPEVLFLDEPFSALDYEMTLFMRDQLQALFMDTKTTMVFVSHDLEEAVYLADDVMLLSRGPAEVADYVNVGIPRPRTSATISEDEFVQVKAHCLDVFQKLVRGT